MGSFNESLKILAKAVNPRAKRSDTKTRLHPAIEATVTMRWRARYNPDGAPRRPEPSEILEICKELSEKTRPIRGRPPNTALEHHVHALMALIEEMCGIAPRAGPFINSVYGPQMRATGGIIETFFKFVDPSVTTTTLANIVMRAHRTGAVRGKRFRDFCPFYGGSIDKETGHPLPSPGFKLESFEPGYPIYCY